MAGRNTTTLLNQLSGRDDTPLAGWKWWLAAIGFGIVIAAIVVFWPTSGGFIYEGF